MSEEILTNEEAEEEVAMKKGGPVRVGVRTCNNRAVEVVAGSQLEGKKGIMIDMMTYGSKYEFRWLQLPELTSQWYSVPKGTMVRPLTMDERKEFITDKVVKELMRNTPISGCSIGTDPEVFVVNKKGIVIPAFTFLPSKDKGNPFWDGFQAEFTTDVQGRGNSGCLAYLGDDVHDGLVKLHKIVHEKFKDEAKITWKTVVEIPADVMALAEPKHWELGCAPSKNVYPQIRPLGTIDGSALPVRFAGCHIHLGHGKLTDDTLVNVIKTMDAVYGVMTVSLFAGMEDPIRRRYYGRAGEYRTPKHGIEYRVTSSAMVAHPVLFHLCFDVARMMSYVGMTIPDIKSYWDYDGDEQIIDIINNYDVPAARKLLKKNKTTLEAFIRRRYGAGHTNALTLIEDGAMGHLPLDSMEKNWILEETARKEWAGHSETKNCCVYRSELK